MIAMADWDELVGKSISKANVSTLGAKVAHV